MTISVISFLPINALPYSEIINIMCLSLLCERPASSITETIYTVVELVLLLSFREKGGGK